MIPGILKLAFRSIVFYKRQVFYQVIIILLLCAVITGSLLTGNSVRTSLKKSASVHLGNAGIVASSGNRYLDPGLPSELRNAQGLDCTGILEIKGSVTNFSTQKAMNNISILAVDTGFFSFHGNRSIQIQPGKAMVNRRLADLLGLKEGDEIIIRIPVISDIPADAPFAPAAEQGNSAVLETGRILTSEEDGNFSLAISQITPLNVFISTADLERISGTRISINRILFNRDEAKTGSIEEKIQNSLTPYDIGLKTRHVSANDSYEIISDRVFIDQALLTGINEKLPSAAPVITYLANRIGSKSGAAPYSFVSALPESLYPEIPPGNGMLINEWLANDLKVREGDSLMMSWFSPDSLNHLRERSGYFIIKGIVGMNGIWADSTLMPDFPGISGKESCSEWDAGVPVKLNEIRDKDEAYWKKYRGTPKAFINYKTGKNIWGNNFGPATSIRFEPGITPESIAKDLKGSMDPGAAGISITDLYSDSIDAASQGVDFSTLFLALGFFLIGASVMLLSFAVSSFFGMRKTQVFSMHALGFRNRTIRKILLNETSIIALAGCVPGAFAGYLVNVVLTAALNSVWRGAVQTDTLSSEFALVPLITGFIISFIITTLMMYILTVRYLGKLKTAGERQASPPSMRRNIIMLSFVFTAAVISFILSFVSDSQRIALCFLSGTFLLFAMLLFIRQRYIKSGERFRNRPEQSSHISGLYYSFYPLSAITPVAFIAAGIFAFFITAVNRKDFDSIRNDRSSGTGGYLLWAETTIPVKEDMNSFSGKAAFGLDADSLSELSFVQMKRSSGNDASCLNLNHIAAPPLLAIDPRKFMSENAFSFAKTLKGKEAVNPWKLIEQRPDSSTIYGIADQTVLDWGLKISVGDTLMMRAENGKPVNIIIAAGLQSSVFQGYVLVSRKFFSELYPSVSGSTIMLVDGNPSKTDTYNNLLTDRFGTYGIDVTRTSDRLAVFYQITNTYLSVFAVFGALGMIIGIAGLGFVLLRNYSQRRREFGLMLATGFSFRKIRKMIFTEQMQILVSGIFTGIFPAIVATLPSLESNHEVSWAYLIIMILLIFLSGIAAIVLSLRSIKEKSLVEILRRD